MLLLVTDGGADHVTHASVQASLIATFVKLDLDFLFAMRTYPTQSWAYLAERVMPILNNALQNVSLEMDSMDDNNEKIISENTNMAKLRSATEDNLNFKEAFQKSMENVISLVGSRFECMHLKEEAVNCHEACGGVEVDAFFDDVRVIDENIDKNKLTVAELTRLEKYSKILEDHCCSHFPN